MTDLPSGLAPLILQGHVINRLRELPENSIQCVVTSPPFLGLRRYDICGCAVRRREPKPGVLTDRTDPRRFDEPNPSCPWCHGTGKIEGMNDVLWGGSTKCAHEWKKTSPRRPRDKDDAGGAISKGNRGASYDASGGKLCAKCNGWLGQFGLEPTAQMYVAHAVKVFRGVRRVLRDDGTCWIEIGDSFSTHPAGLTGEKRWAASGLGNVDHTGAEQAGSIDRRTAGSPREKNLMLVPQRLAIAFQDDGWIVRSIVIWHRQNPMPEAVRDRPTQSHSYILMLTKEPRYFFDQEATRETAQGGHSWGKAVQLSHGKMGTEDSVIRSKPSWYASMREQVPAGGGRNIRYVWTIPTKGYPGAHFATFPESLPERCILASTSEKGACPKCGSPWERVMSDGGPDLEWRRACGGDANGEYHGEAIKRYEGTGAENASDVKRRILAGLWRRQTVGWRPTCSCGESATVPCTVLDPFAGSGTTLAVAKRLGRASVGIEMNPMYVSLIRQRVAEAITESVHHPSQRRLVEFGEATA